MTKALVSYCLWASAVFAACSVAAPAFDAQRLKQPLVVGPWLTEYKIMSFFLLPEQEVDVYYRSEQGALTPPAFAACRATVCEEYPQGRWKFKAPSRSGLVTYRVQAKGSAEAILHFFVMHPAGEIKDEKLNGYRIGQYPDKPYKGLANYMPPKGFVEVNRDNENVFIAPHYQLKQFVSKQGGGDPRYVVLQTRLLRKLEFLTEEVNNKGISCNGLHIMSGYRTPYYNKAIKNKLWSRHQWGGAADVFVDENPKDGYMDDLNKDGKTDIHDAKVLASIIESHFPQVAYQQFIGGMGLYKKNAAHGPFVHIDVRGFRARW